MMSSFHNQILYKYTRRTEINIRIRDVHGSVFRDGQSGPGPGTEFLFFTGTGTKFFSRRDQNFFLTGTGTKNDWSRSCLGVVAVVFFNNHSGSGRFSFGSRYKKACFWTEIQYLEVQNYETRRILSVCNNHRGQFSTAMAIYDKNVVLSKDKIN
jgi:hypothetical protein